MHVLKYTPDKNERKKEIRIFFLFRERWGKKYSIRFYIRKGKVETASRTKKKTTFPTLCFLRIECTMMYMAKEEKKLVKNLPDGADIAYSS